MLTICVYGIKSMNYLIFNFVLILGMVMSYSAIYVMEN